MKPSIKLAKSIIGSFLVNVRHHPEFLKTQESGSKICERNFLVGKVLEAIQDLEKEL